MDRQALEQEYQSAAAPWLTREDAALVRLSFEQLAPQSDAMASQFYARLFELDPGLRAYFPADMAAQREKLMLTLARAVAHLDRFEAVAPEVAALGQRHRAYGARELDYVTVGDALLFALAQCLGEGFTREVEDAWEKTFTALSQAMLRAAHDAGV